MATQTISLHIHECTYQSQMAALYTSHTATHSCKLVCEFIAEITSKLAGTEHFCKPHHHVQQMGYTPGMQGLVGPGLRPAEPTLLYLGFCRPVATK